MVLEKLVEDSKKGNIEEVIKCLDDPTLTDRQNEARYYTTLLHYCSAQHTTYSTQKTTPKVANNLLLTWLAHYYSTNNCNKQ